MSKPSIFELTERQWVQVRAALLFWRQVAEQSQRHPSDHHAVRDLFTEYGPLNLSEIDELVEGLPRNLLIKPHKLANQYGVQADTMKDRIKRAGIEPDMVVNRTKLYRIDALLPLIEAMEKKRAKSSRQ